MWWLLAHILTRCGRCKKLFCVKYRYKLCHKLFCVKYRYKLKLCHKLRYCCSINISYMYVMMILFYRNDLQVVTASITQHRPAACISDLQRALQYSRLHLPGTAVTTTAHPCNFILCSTYCNAKVLGASYRIAMHCYMSLCLWYGTLTCASSNLVL